MQSIGHIFLFCIFFIVCELKSAAVVHVCVFDVDRTLTRPPDGTCTQPYAIPDIPVAPPLGNAKFTKGDLPGAYAAQVPFENLSTISIYLSLSRLCCGTSAIRRALLVSTY